MAEKKAPPSAPAEAGLKRAATHVSHDIRRLAEAYERHSDVFAWTAWYVFFRSVTEFLRPNDPKKDDILAEHYFDDPEEWRAVVAKAEAPADFEAFRTATNKLAAHLTYARLDYEGDERWAPSAEVTDYLLGLAGVFFDKLPEHRKLWFGRLHR